MFKKFYESYTNNKKEGDIIICYDENDKPVMLPINNRYLNTLIIGSVSSGRTTLSLLDMFYQDLNNSNCGVTYIDPQPDFCERAFAMAKSLNRNVTYLNPELNNCIKFNPLNGEEEYVIANLCCAFEMFNKNENNHFLDLSNKVLCFSIKILKRLYGNKVSLKELSDFINNDNEYGIKSIEKFESLLSKNNENDNIVTWLKTQYFNNNFGQFNDISKLRKQLKELITDKYLKDILTLSEESELQITELNFEKSFENKDILIITPFIPESQNKSKLLGYLLILELQATIFRRKNIVPNVTPNCLYINEYQLFNNFSFTDTLITATSYRIAITIAISNTESLLDNFNTDSIYINYFLSLIFNYIIHSDLSKSDAELFTRILNEYSNSNNFNIKDMMYKNFKEISYRIYKNNNYECANGKLKFLTKDVNDKIIELEKELKFNLINKKTRR